jgi:hypothetical protein
MTDLTAAALEAVKLYAAMHPRPTHVTQKQAGEMLGLSHPTISKLVAEGVLTLNRCGLIPIEDVDHARATRRRAA